MLKKGLTSAVFETLQLALYLFLVDSFMLNDPSRTPTLYKTDFLMKIPFQNGRSRLAHHRVTLE